MKIKSDIAHHADRGRADASRFFQAPSRPSRGARNAAIEDDAQAVTTRRHPQALANRSPRIAIQRKMQESIHRSPRMARTPGDLVERKEKNRTGLPDALKSGIETLSGLTMDDVKVHYNSPKPAQLQALAYTRGTDIHVAPGQERHIAHEAWHVVQQKRQWVAPTLQAQGLPINDDVSLEREADVMGVKALQMRRPDHAAPASPARTSAFPVVQRYTVAHGHRIANDHTAAVQIGVNNKLLYATQGRIQTSNQVLAHKQMPISLEMGAQRDGLVHDQVLRTVTPKFEAIRSGMNRLPPDVRPQAGGVHRVMLPSECEKGAIAVIGAFTKTQRSAGNARVYHDKDHANARVGELLAQSTAPNPQKAIWYQEWVQLDEGVDKATSAYNSHTYLRARRHGPPVPAAQRRRLAARIPFELRP